MAGYSEVSYAEVAYADAAAGGHSDTIAETLSVIEALGGQGDHNTTLIESLTYTDPDIPFVIAVQVTESFAVNMTMTELLGHVFSETFALTENYDVGQQLYPELIEQLDFDDLARLIFKFSETDTFSLADTLSELKGWVYVQAETLELSESVDPVQTINRAIASVITILDAIGQGGAISESLIIVDTLSRRATAVAELLDAFAAADTATPIFGFSGQLTDALVHTDTAARTAACVALLEDGFEFALLDTHSQELYTAWVVNTRNQGVTEYTNYSFNSTAKIGGSYYGASATGLYLLEGDDDAGTPIAAVIKTARTELSPGKKTRVEQAYIGVRNSGKMVLKVITDDDNERWYEANFSAHGVDTQRFKTGRGVVSRYWQWELVNQDGDDFELEQLEVYPVVLTRRV